MSGELTKVFGGGKAVIKGDAAAVANALTEDLAETGDGQGGSGNLFLNFSGKAGKYSLGREREDMDPEEPFALDVTSFTRGWVFWRSNKVVKRHRWAVGQPGVAESELEDLEAPKQADGWKAERAFIARSLDDGKQVEYSTSTISACNVIADLMANVAERINSGAEDIYPVIGFDKEQFVAHEQTNWKPKLDIMGWVSQEQLIAYEAEELELDDLLAGEDAEPEQVESKAKKKAAPKKRRRAAL